jgi:hypothetical protein
MKIISIVPRLPPEIDGVGNYALSLAQQLRQDHGIQTCFLVGDPNWPGEQEVHGFSVLKPTERSAQALADQLHQKSDVTIVLLHLSIYGYAKWALCDWLLKGIKLWRKNSQNVSIVTMFHELYAAPSYPWKHDFWVASLQKKIIIQFSKLSTVSLTNCNFHADKLSRLSDKKLQNANVFPVFSSIGELSQAPALVDRKPQLVVFGQRANRLNVYQQSVQTIHNFCAQLGVTKIIDIGKPTGLDLHTIFSVPVQEMGPQPEAVVSQILSDSMAGWLSYGNSCYFSKSSIFASYCSHGLIPIIQTQQTAVADQLTESQHYLRAQSFQSNSSVLISFEDLQQIATNAYNWYQTHTLSQQASDFADILLRASAKARIVPPLVDSETLSVEVI